jgi:hypothetical protein
MWRRVSSRSSSLRTGSLSVGRSRSQSRQSWPLPQSRNLCASGVGMGSSMSRDGEPASGVIAGADVAHTWKWTVWQRLTDRRYPILLDFPSSAAQGHATGSQHRGPSLFNVSERVAGAARRGCPGGVAGRGGHRDRGPAEPPRPRLPGGVREVRLQRPLRPRGGRGGAGREHQDARVVPAAHRLLVFGETPQQPPTRGRPPAPAAGLLSVFLRSRDDPRTSEHEAPKSQGVIRVLASSALRGPPSTTTK